MKNYIRKGYIAFLVVIMIVLNISCETIGSNATTSRDDPYGFSKTVYTVTSVSKPTTVYSDWHRVTDVTKAGRTGEGGHYNRTYSVKTTSSLDATIPIKQLTLKLGYSVEKTKTSTIFGYRSANLKKGQSCALYYRDRWKQYTVSMTVKQYKGNKLVREYCTSKVVKVAQTVDSAYDYGWMYTTGSPSRLGKTIPKKVKKGSWI